MTEPRQLTPRGKERRHQLMAFAAARFAEGGFHPTSVAEIVSGQWKGSERKLAADPVTAATFLPNGHPLAPGEIFANPKLAATLERAEFEGAGADGVRAGPLETVLVERRG